MVDDPIVNHISCDSLTVFLPLACMTLGLSNKSSSLVWSDLNFSPLPTDGECVPSGLIIVISKIYSNMNISIWVCLYIHELYT